MPLLDEGLRRRGTPIYDPDEALPQQPKRRRFNLSRKFERRDATRQFQSVSRFGDLRRRIAQALAKKREEEAKIAAEKRQEAMGRFRAVEQAMQPLASADEKRRTAASSWFRTPDDDGEAASGMFRSPDDEEAKARRERIAELRIAANERRMAEVNKRFHDAHRAGEAAATPTPTPTPTPGPVPGPTPAPSISATPVPDDKDERDDDERFIEGFGGPTLGPQPQSWNKLTGEITDKATSQVIGNRQPSGTIQRFEEILNEELQASVAQFGGGYPAQDTGPYEAAEERALERWKAETSEWGSETFIHQQGKFNENDLVDKMRSASPFDLKDFDGYAGIIRDELRGRRSDGWESPKAGTLEDGKLLDEYKRNLEAELTTQLQEEYDWPAESAPGQAHHLISAGLHKMRVALAQDSDNPIKDRHEQNIAISLAMRASEVQDLMLDELGWTDEMRAEQEVPEHIQNLVLAKVNDELGNYLPLPEASEMRGGFLGWKKVAGKLLGPVMKLMNADFIPVYPSAKALETAGFAEYEEGAPTWGSLSDSFEGGAYFSRPVAKLMLEGMGGAVWGGEWAFEGLTGVDTEHKVSGAIKGQVANAILTEVINPAGLVIILPFVGPAIRGARGASLVGRLTSVMFMTGLEPKLIPGVLKVATAVGKGGIKGMVNIPAAVKASPQAMRLLGNAVRNFHSTHLAGEMGRLRGGLLSRSGETALKNWRNKGVMPTMVDMRKMLRENGIPYTRTSTKDDMMTALAAEKMKISEPATRTVTEAFSEGESRELAALEAKTVVSPEEGVRLDVLRGRAFKAAAGTAKEPDYITAYHGYSSTAPKVADDGTLANDLHFAGDRGIAEEYAHRAVKLNGGEAMVYEVRIPRADFTRRGNVYFGSKIRLKPVAEHGVTVDAAARATERTAIRAGEAATVSGPELAKMVRGSEKGPLSLIEEATTRLIDEATSYNPGSAVDAHAASLLGEVERGYNYKRLFRSVTMSADDLTETLSRFRVGEETTLGAVGFSRTLKKASAAATSLEAMSGVDRPRRVVFTAERTQGFDLAAAGAKAVADDPTDVMVAGKFVVSSVSTKGNVTRIGLRPSSQRFPVSRMHELRITEAAQLDPGLERWLAGDSDLSKAVVRQMAEQEVGEKLPRSWSRAKIASRLKEEKAGRMMDALAKEADNSLAAEAAGAGGAGRGEPPSGIDSPANPNPKGPKPGQFPRQIKNLEEVIADAERGAKSYMASITRVVGKQPILRGIIDNINPSALADGRFEYTFIGFARKKQAVMLYSELHNFVMGERESRLGFSFVNNVSQSKNIVKPQFGMLPTPEAIVVFPERFNLSKKQLDFVDEVRGFLNEQSAFERVRDVPLKVLYDDTSNVRQYFHNEVIEAPSEAAKAAIVHRRTAKIGGVKNYMKQRVFKEMQDGIENGYKYGDTITANVMARYRSGQMAALDQELLQLAAKEKSISTDAIQAAMSETLKGTEQAPLKFLEWFNNIARPMVTGADLGFLGLQVVPGFSRNPVAAAKGMHYMMDALVTDSRLMAGYWRNHIKQGWVARYLGGGGSLNQTETSFEFAGRTGIEGALFHQGPMGRFTNSFSSSLNIIAMENFKAMVGINDFLFKALGKRRFSAVVTRAFGGPAHWFKGFDSTEVDTAAAAVSSKLTMRFNSALLNIPKKQAQLERALAFAPGYYRAFFGLLGDAIQGGMRGAESRRVLGQMAAGFFAGNYLLEKATGQQMSFNPFDPNFMTVGVGGIHAGVGGPFVSLLRAIAKVASVPESKEGLWGVKGPEVLEGLHIGLNPNLTKWKFWDKDVNTNPILRWGRGKLSPAASLIMDVVQGETFVYEPVHTPRQFLEGVRKRMTPFFIQAAREVEGGLWTKDALIAGSLEFFSGARTWPLRPSEKFEESWDEKYGEEYGKYNSEDPKHRDLAKKDEELTALDEQVRQDSAKFFGDESTVMTEDILRREEDALGDTAERILAGSAEAYSNWGMNRKLALNSIADRRSDENMEWGDPKSEIGKLVQEYYDIRPEQFPSDDVYAGYVDWDAYEATREAVLDRMDPERATLIRDRDRFRTPEIEAIDKRWRQYQDDRDELEETVPIYRFLDSKEDELAVEELMTTAATVRDLLAMSGESVSRPEILEMLLQATLANPDAYGIDWKVIAVSYLLSQDTTRDLALSNERDEFIISHPDMALFSKGMWDNLSREEQLEWIEQNPGKPHRAIKSIWED